MGNPKNVPYVTESMGKSWEENHPVEAYMQNGWSPKAAMLMDKLVKSGIPPELAPAAVQGLGFDPEVDTRNNWQRWKEDHPIRGYAKERLTQDVVPAAKGAIKFLAGSPLTNHRDMEVDRLRKERAAESLQNHLMIQALQQSAYQTQMNLNKVIPATQNPPLADFAAAGQNQGLQIGPAQIAPTSTPMIGMGMPRGR